MTTVIHHSADFDGIFCREIAKKFLPDANIIGWDFGQPRIKWPEEGRIYVLDLPPECLYLPERHESEPDITEISKRMIWIDHHKSSIEKWDGKCYPYCMADIPGYRIDGVAACRLSYQWFVEREMLGKELPNKQEFLDRQVKEPLAVRLAGEYDVWDHRDNKEDVTFQFGLRSQEKIDWEGILKIDDGAIELVNSYLRDGDVAERYSKNGAAEVIKSKGFDLQFEGLNFLALNTTKKSSITFEAGIQPRHDACMAFSYDGNNKVWVVSMYGADHKDVDLSKIAIKHGGGGHKKACGFQTKNLSDILE